MEPKSRSIGMDVGGSHISAALIEGTSGLPVLKTRTGLDSHDSAHNIIAALGNGIKELLAGKNDIAAIGIAFPGPFDYEKGVCAIANVGGKFEKTFGLHIAQAIKDYTGLYNTRFQFFNDAHCFAAGARRLYGLTGKRTVFITLGTGFGSAFMLDGSLLQVHPDIPASGAFYDQDFCDAKADDYFSTRWLLNTYAQTTGVTIFSVKDLVESGTADAQAVMSRYGENMGSFLLPWLQRFNCDELVIGGNITKAFSSFGPSLKEALGHEADTINIILCNNTEDCIITGAAVMAGNEKLSNSDKTMRKTSQGLLPVTASTDDSGVYNIYPSFSSGEKVYRGFASLATAIRNEKVIIIDGYGGVLWEHFREQLQGALSTENKKIYWYDISTCQKPAAAIDEMIAGSLNGDDPVFGKRYTGDLLDFFDEKKLKLINPDPAADICIIYGTGAALAGIKGKLLYADVPKNEIQYRMRAGSITNLGASEAGEPTQMYKRFYFVDWPVLSKHKAKLLPRVDYIIDEQRINEITWMKGDAFRNAIGRMLEQPFRARPWFEAGVWGGDWMKQHIPQLNQHEVNYAWSFELITPENGIVLEGENNLLEVSFDYLLYADNTKLLGKAAKRFGTEFPIRFDFLDTFDGGNLSIQCHPRPAYAKEHFGENFTQDETYYILDCNDDAVVYLGFQDDINPETFERALVDAQETGVEMDAEKYVQKFPAHKHDLFLIPNGTIHASGKNNMVLEISSTPYIFTFKQYDWQRLGLNGQPRPINIEHAMNNLYFDRKGDYVASKLISHPVVEAEWEGGRKIQLPTHEEHFYCVYRYEFTGSISIPTNNQCHICMLVEGESISVDSHGHSADYHYAETFVVPAAAGNYQVTNRGNGKAFVVVAHVKDDHC
ncbi:ROK family protein [Chitinophaga polysaccharea]|uniref:ROK family protein n=1 Tax=Chitinophaga TaxID=79328 RepID=UPI0014557D25|nr:MULTISPECIES: ROK family protein [Chitinophaga]NLR59279.1 ROK family protein [Chitinophaga polysaccharea]NLU91954.1 ROK family protein [Chitinophaga sp. Ak27]